MTTNYDSKKNKKCPKGKKNLPKWFRPYLGKKLKIKKTCLH